MPYVNQRWLGGMLTNFQTVYKRLQRLKELEIIEQTGGENVLTKKEALVLKREKDKLERTLGGLRDMTKVPSAVWIIDTKKEHIAVDEARKLNIPVVAILDTNCDPDEVDYKIPGNDDAIRSVTLLTRVIADAVADGLMARVRTSQDGDDKPEGLATDEPLAEWEQELLRGQAAEGTPAASEGQTVEGAGVEAPATASAAPDTAAPEAVAPATEAVAPATEAAAPATEAAAPQATAAPEADAAVPTSEAAAPTAEAAAADADAAAPEQPQS